MVRLESERGTKCTELRTRDSARRPDHDLGRRCYVPILQVRQVWSKGELTGGREREMQEAGDPGFVAERMRGSNFGVLNLETDARCRWPSRQEAPERQDGSVLPASREQINSLFFPVKTHFLGHPDGSVG